MFNIEKMEVVGSAVAAIMSTGFTASLLYFLILKFKKLVTKEELKKSIDAVQSDMKREFEIIILKQDAIVHRMDNSIDNLAETVKELRQCFDLVPKNKN